MKKFLTQFGGKIDSSEIQKLAKSDHWIQHKFENLEATSMDISLRTIPGLLKKQFTNTSERTPKANLPIEPFDLDAFNKGNNQFVWYGHSVILMKINGKTILFDPMFGPDASPIGPVRTKRFSEKTLDIIDELPEIDVLLMSHDHYDHLDLDSYQKIKHKVKAFYVPLGVKRHLSQWGVSSELITELDWWNNFTIEDIFIEFIPSRHFSGRGLSDRAKSLWGGFVFKTNDLSICISGDGGYGDHFKTIGEKHGPFDFAFIECGQYNKEWHQIHMYPEESVQAALDLKAKVSMPIHWAGFKLALHPWKEPIERFVAEANLKKISIATPNLGQLVSFEKTPEANAWWQDYA